MDYAQVWIKLSADSPITSPFEGHADDPIKHPCLWKDAGGELAALGGAAVQPVVMINDSALWKAVADYAMNHQQTVDTVIAAALWHHVQPGIVP